MSDKKIDNLYAALMLIEILLILKNILTVIQVSTISGQFGNLSFAIPQDRL